MLSMTKADLSSTPIEIPTYLYTRLNIGREYEPKKGLVETNDIKSRWDRCSFKSGL